MFTKNPIYDFRESNPLSAKYRDLTDTIPFIDYVQLHCDKVPISFLLCKEDVNNRFRFWYLNKFLKYTVEEKSENVFIYTLENQMRFYFYDFHWDNNTFAGTQAKCKIYISSSALPNSTLQVQINTIKKLIHSIRPAKGYRTAEDENLPYIRNMIKWSDCKVSRIDLAINCYKSNYYLHGELKNDFDFENINISYKGRPKIIKYFQGNYCTGIGIGTGKNSTQLKVYDKDLDPNNGHDLIRFGTTNFARLEYKIPRYILRNYNLNDSKLDVASDLMTNKILLLWRNSLNAKHINLWSLYKTRLPRAKRFKTDIKITDVRTMQMVKGLLKKYKFVENLAYKEMLKSVDNFFNKNCKITKETIKETNAIIYK